MLDRLTLLPLWDRTIPGSGASTAPDGGTSVANVVLIVGLALVITVLARYLARRGGGRK